jgi:hypothetical protein
MAAMRAVMCRVTGWDSTGAATMVSRNLAAPNPSASAAISASTARHRSSQTARQRGPAGSGKRLDRQREIKTRARAQRHGQPQGSAVIFRRPATPQRKRGEAVCQFRCPALSAFDHG